MSSTSLFWWCLEKLCSWEAHWDIEHDITCFVLDEKIDFRILMLNHDWIFFKWSWFTRLKYNILDALQLYVSLFKVTFNDHLLKRQSDFFSINSISDKLNWIIYWKVLLAIFEKSRDLIHFDLNMRIFCNCVDRCILRKWEEVIKNDVSWWSYDNDCTRIEILNI